MRFVANLIKFILIVVWTIHWCIVGMFFGIITFNTKVPNWFASKIWAPFVIVVLGIKLDAKGLDKIDYSKTNIFISNHQSFADIAVLFYLLKTNLYFIAKYELKKYPFLGWFMIVAGMIFVKRGQSEEAKKSMKLAAEYVKKEKSVVIFPEGTRSKNGDVAGFKKGSFLLALSSGVNIVPIGIEGTDLVWAHDIFKSRPAVVKFRVGDTIDISKYSIDTVSMLVSDSEQAVKQLKNA